MEKERKKKLKEMPTDKVVKFRVVLISATNLEEGRQVYAMIGRRRTGTYTARGGEIHFENEVCLFLFLSPHLLELTRKHTQVF